MSDSTIKQISDALTDVMADGKIDQSDIARALFHFVSGGAGVAIKAVPGGAIASDVASSVGLDPASLVGHLRSLKKD
jgi:hypothetical protein